MYQITIERFNFNRPYFEYTSEVTTDILAKIARLEALYTPIGGYREQLTVIVVKRGGNTVYMASLWADRKRVIINTLEETK